MSKSKGVARLRYDEKNDQLVLETRHHDEVDWDFCMSAKFFRLHEDEPDAEMISYRIFKTWYNWMQNNGYELFWG